MPKMCIIFTVVCMLEVLVVSEAGLSSSTTPVPRFPCGNDRCLINHFYCSHEDSTDPEDWVCQPCSEIRQWCTSQIHRVPTDCYGYCVVRRIKEQVMSTEAKLKLKYEMENKKINKSLQVKLNQLEKQQSLTLQEYSNYKNRAIIPSGDLDKFLINIRYPNIILSLVGIVAIIFLLIAKYRQRRRGGRRQSYNNECYGETTLVENPALANHTDSTGRQPEKMFEEKEIQTDISGPVSGILRNEVVFTQPHDKGHHGIRVLPKATVGINSIGVEDLEAVSFLDQN